MITISIIVPIYKVEKYLHKCLESIASQSFQSWECILVDDGSPDSSALICEEFVKKDSRFFLIKKFNGGVSSARNLGIKEAKGEWVTFIDADDFIGEAYLQGLIEPLLEGNRLDFIHGGCTNYENGRITSVNQKYEYYLGVDKVRLFRSFRGLVVSKLFRKAILFENNLLFDETIKIAEDMVFTLDYLLYVNKYAFVPETSYYYRRDNNTSATHVGIKQNYQKGLYAFSRLYDGMAAYIQQYKITEKDAIDRYKQQAEYYYAIICSLYFDKLYQRSQRLDIIRKESKSEYFSLLKYIDKDSSSYNYSRMLLKSQFRRFDFCQMVKTLVIQIKRFLRKSKK